jgi:guanylate kinase
MLSERGLPIVISAASGTGKTTVTKRLIDRRPSLTYSISCTTRPPRPGEVDGKDYFFVTEERFEELREGDGLAEWAVVHGCRYGTPKAFLEETMAAGRDILLDIDVQGALQIKACFPEGVYIFLLPPSWEVLAGRLSGRGTDTAESIARRLATAREEIALVGGYGYAVVNDDLDRAVATVGAIIDAEHCRTERLDGGRFSEAFGLLPPHKA